MRRDCFSVPLRATATLWGGLRLAVKRDAYAWRTTRASFDAITRSRFHAFISATPNACNTKIWLLDPNMNLVGIETGHN